MISNVFTYHNVTKVLIDHLSSGNRQVEVVYLTAEGRRCGARHELRPCDTVSMPTHQGNRDRTVVVEYHKPQPQGKFVVLEVTNRYGKFPYKICTRECCRQAALNRTAKAVALGDQVTIETKTTADEFVCDYCRQDVERK